MKLLKGAWKILVGIKDALVLAFMLLFFSVLFMALSAQPNPAIAHRGALVIALDGTLVEQPVAQDPFSSLSGQQTTGEIAVRDVVRALDAATTDARVKAVVLDLDNFTGGYPVAVSEVADAVARVRRSGKPVLAFATSYTDAGYLIAANASDIWVDPLGGAMFTGPGGTQLYYKGLLDRLGVNVHVYRVGQFKSAVEPYTLTEMSPAAREANAALYNSLFSQWRAAVRRARPNARIDQFVAQPDAVIRAAGGDLARASRNARLVDHTGDRAAFGRHVAGIVGAPNNAPSGNFNMISMRSWLAAHPENENNAEIGVLTVAGEIVDGEADAGSAGGATLTRMLLQGIAKHKLKALVVRVDSPGGSALASEHVRSAILQAKAKGIPVVVSMGSLAASGGYWVSTAGDVIFAEPNTITGSIGIFGMIPSFENSLSKIGVTTSTVQTTPLTGQPDLMGGINSTTDSLIQSTIENGYRRFINLVAQSRHMQPARVAQIAEGRVWVGGTARQIGLVDRFGGLDDAVAEAARRAGLDPSKARTIFFRHEANPFAAMLAAFESGEENDGWLGKGSGGDMASRVSMARQAVLAQAVDDVRRIGNGPAMQARCLECAALAPPRPVRSDEQQSLFQMLLARLFG